MRNRTPNDLVSQIESLLEKEHNALVNGELDALVKLLEQKQSLIDALNAAPFTEIGAL